MWMLNYPFPYSDSGIGRAYSVLTHRLAEAVRGIGTPAFESKVSSYLKSRKDLVDLLAPNDYKYFAFQCWQEGTARYTEIDVAQTAANEHHRDRRFSPMHKPEGCQQRGPKPCARFTRVAAKCASRDGRASELLCSGSRRSAVA